MPEPEKWDYKRTGLLTEEEIKNKKARMSPSLFAANYELRHIASEDVIFEDADIGAPIEKVMNAKFSHIDAAYGGEDNTAYTVAKKVSGRYYVYGRLWHKHVDDVQDQIIGERKRLLAGKIYCEDNSDKGYLANDLRKKGERVITYHEDMNKHIKIVTHLKGAWPDITFVEGTDPEYIEQILDYNEDAEHDDAPDSLACMMRILNPLKDEDSQPSGFGFH